MCGFFAAFPDNCVKTIMVLLHSYQMCKLCTNVWNGLTFGICFLQKEKFYSNELVYLVVWECWVINIQEFKCNISWAFTCVIWKGAWHFFSFLHCVSELCVVVSSMSFSLLIVHKFTRLLLCVLVYKKTVKEICSVLKSGWTMYAKY